MSPCVSYITTTLPRVSTIAYLVQPAWPQSSHAPLASGQAASSRARQSSASLAFAHGVPKACDSWWGSTPYGITCRSAMKSKVASSVMRSKIEPSRHARGCNVGCGVAGLPGGTGVGVGWLVSFVGALLSVPTTPGPVGPVRGGCGDAVTSSLSAAVSGGSSPACPPQPAMPPSSA
jgi:hypothetical protein